MASNYNDYQMQQFSERIDTISRRLEQLERRAMKRIVRKMLVPPALQKIQLHQQTIQHYIDLVGYLPANEYVKAVLVTVKVVHSNHPCGHAYLGFNAYQAASPADQRTSFYEQTYNCHGTVHHQELIVPWDNTESNSTTNLVIDITNSYNTGSYQNHGNVNHFEITVTGYIL